MVARSFECSQRAIFPGVRLILGIALSVGFSGCAGKSIGFGGGPSAHETSLTPAESPTQPISSHSPKESIQTVHLIFDVLRIEFPVSDSRYARNVWNHLDRLRLDPEKAALLERNGLRIGIAGESAWPPLNAIFESADASIDHQQIAAQPGLPVTIPVGPVGESESMFIHSHNGALSGRTFNGGNESIALDYAVRPEMAGATNLVIRLEIQKDTGAMTWERQPDGTTLQVPGIERFSFDDLAAALTLRAGEFVVIGMGDSDANEQLVGPRFFMRRGASGKVETLLCITPRYFRTPIEARSRS